VKNSLTSSTWNLGLLDGLSLSVPFPGYFTQRFSSAGDTHLARMAFSHKAELFTFTLRCICLLTLIFLQVEESPVKMRLADIDPSKPVKLPRLVKATGFCPVQDLVELSNYILNTVASQQSALNLVPLNV
jgi:hypothetical protein